jgi:hypothetical protein
MAGAALAVIATARLFFATRTRDALPTEATEAADATLIATR